MMLRTLNVLFVLLIVILVATTAYLNSQTVLFDYLAGNIEIPLSILLVFCFLLGAVIATIASIGIILQQKYRISRLNKKIS